MRENVQRAVDLVAAIVGIAAIAMLLRPSSKGPALVETFMGAFVDAIAAAEGATISPNRPSTTATAATFSEAASGPTPLPIGTVTPGGFPNPPGTIGPPNPSIQQRLRNALNL